MAIDDNGSGTTISDILGDMVAQMGGTPRQNSVKFNDVNEDHDDQDEDSDQEDVPSGKKPENYGIRMSKMKNQRDSERSARQKAEAELSLLKSKFSENENSKILTDEEELLSTFTDNEKIIYQKAKEALVKLENVTGTVGKISQEKVSDSLSKRAEIFFEDNPSISKNREEVESDMVNYLSNKPEMRTLLIGGEMSMSAVYGAMMGDKVKSTSKNSASPNSGRVFGDKRSSGFGGGLGEDNDSGSEIFNKSISILRDKNSRNKSDAVKAGIEKFLAPQLLGHIRK
ncbi:hypothetical protein UFOVP1009_13 [uncultured Caudovirales phage]|uniref:Uncharacterized protein n=1 Tax=uncultured Caudovirales phage TaxID=2100421 RepID=A0A6J5Q0R7_9CAUD|nr:hypothetical protein UFOVP1009_13 [uncultured Caudovirales phage]